MSLEPGVREARAEGYESSRPNVRALVPASARRVLDLGCSSGYLGAALKQSGIREVVGIEIDPDYAREAATRLDRVECLDLDDFPGSATASSIGRFDCVVAADVLEHCKDPTSVLATAASLLDSGGTVVMSLPNVRHWTVARSVFLRGTWPRNDAGIFDRTHLRWFTRSDAVDLLNSAGLVAQETRPQYWEPDALRSVFRIVDRSPMRDFFAYALITRASKP